MAGRRFWRKELQEPVEYGLSKTGTLVHVTAASRGVPYYCPTCGQRLELHRGPKIECFTHWRGLEGTKECDFFVPGRGSTSHGTSATSPPLEALVEDDPSELGLILDQLDGEWGLALRLPEIPLDELGALPLSALRGAMVEIVVGGDPVSRISALDLRPGVGGARIFVPPSLQEYGAQPIGLWPSTIEDQRWNLRSRALDAKGTLFRLRRGEWTRLVARSVVHAGESLLMLADERCPPSKRVSAQGHARLAASGLNWRIWEMRLPNELDAELAMWLARIGHDFVPRPWSVRLGNPPRAYSSDGQPIFWIGDRAVLRLEAPTEDAETFATFSFGSNSQGATVRASAGSALNLAVTCRTAGPASLSLDDEQSKSLDVLFVARPDGVAIAQLLEQTPRLRLWVGELRFEAWTGSVHRLSVQSQTLPEVRVDLASESARGRVTLWERKRQRSYSGLAAREIAEIVRNALHTASRIAIDAENLGRIELAPTIASARTCSTTPDRLSWRDYAQRMNGAPHTRLVPVISNHPRIGSQLILRKVDRSGLVRARLALKRRRESSDGVP